MSGFCIRNFQNKMVNDHNCLTTLTTNYDENKEISKDPVFATHFD